MLSFLKGSKNSDALLFAGLGNPGGEYEGHRHNIGFMAIDKIAAEYNFPPFRRKFEGLFSEGSIDGHKIILLKPMTYMNNSGQSVKAAAKFFKVTPAQVVVFHDEIELEPSKVRIKIGGGNAGHNGLKSIQAHLGTPDFKRVRLGVGHPGNKERVHGHVLSDFSKTECKQWLETLLDGLASHAALLAAGDEAGYMNKIALSLKEI
jgi:PTH1 family peptidyl-tRNA hydrolase